MSNLRRLQAQVSQAGGEIKAKRAVQVALKAAGFHNTPRAVTRGGYRGYVWRDTPFGHVALLREGSGKPVLHRLLTYVGRLPKGFHVPATRGQPALVLAETAAALVEQHAARKHPRPQIRHNPERRYVGEEEVASFGAPSRSQARRARERTGEAIVPQATCRPEGPPGCAGTLTVAVQPA